MKHGKVKVRFVESAIARPGFDGVADPRHRDFAAIALEQFQANVRKVTALILSHPVEHQNELFSMLDIPNVNHMSTAQSLAYDAREWDGREDWELWCEGVKENADLLSDEIVRDNP